MAKNKLLVWGDSPRCGSGFGRVVRELFRDAHKHYEVAILGINDYGLQKGSDANKYYIYSIDSQDRWGFGKMQIVLPDFQPDAIFLLQDVYHIQTMLGVIEKTYGDHPIPPIYVYFPVDGQPFSRAWGRQVLQNKLVTKVFSYSEYANMTMAKAFPEEAEKILDYTVLYHGVDDVFKVLPQDIVDKNRKVFVGCDEPRFMICTVNRFTPRKQLTLSLRAAALFTYGYSICDNCGVYQPTQQGVCDLCGGLCSDTREGHDDVTYYVHAKTKDSSMGPPTIACSLINHAINAGYPESCTKDRTLLFPARDNLQQPYTDEELCMIYNMASVNLTLSQGEGFGLSMAESSACGTTNIAANNSVVPEVLGTHNNHHLIKNVGWVSPGNDNGFFRPVPSINDTVDALEAEYQKWVLGGRVKIVNEKAVEWVKGRFSWDVARKVLYGGVR